jgi:hypothetical protein
MNKYIKMSILPICLALSGGCASSSIAETPKVINQSKQLIVNGYEIETVASSSAYPTGIQVTPVANGLQIMGAVAHKLHQPRRIRGHVDVELVDASGQIVKRFTIPLKHQFSRTKRVHSVGFSVLIPDEVPNEYQIRIRHNIGNGDHQ